LESKRSLIQSSHPQEIKTFISINSAYPLEIKTSLIQSSHPSEIKVCISRKNYHPVNHRLKELCLDLAGRLSRVGHPMPTCLDINIIHFEGVYNIWGM
jgi:hypothetical protein